MSDIVVRKVKFEFPDDLNEVFPGVDPLSETYLAAFSLTMPSLEPYLIRTYRSVAERITDPALADDLRAFIAQEAQHFQNHRRVNELMKAQLGTDVAAKLEAIEERLEAEYRRFNAKKSARFNLVYAEGFEAMTCAMVMDAFEQVAAGGDGPGGEFTAWRQLWAWHGAEEIEHRTVAFRVYEHLVGSYPYRVYGSFRAQWHYHRYIMRLQRVLLAAQGHKAGWHQPPWMKTARPKYLRTFRRDYDPALLKPDPLVDLILGLYAPES